MLRSGQQEQQKTPPHYLIPEYQRLKFFWDEFGLNRLDVEQLEIDQPGWLEEMLQIGSARSKAMNEYTSSAAEQGPIEPQAPLSMDGAKGLGGSGKQVIRRKLM